MPPAAYRRHTLWTICLYGLIMHLADVKRDVRELLLKLYLQDWDVPDTVLICAAAAGEESIYN